MPRLPAFTPKQVVRVLERHGFVLDHSSGSHRVFYQASTGRRVVVPFHKRDIPRGALFSILKQSGIPREEW